MSPDAKVLALILHADVSLSWLHVLLNEFLQIQKPFSVKSLSVFVGGFFCFVFFKWVCLKNPVGFQFNRALLKSVRWTEKRKKERKETRQYVLSCRQWMLFKNKTTAFLHASLSECSPANSSGKILCTRLWISDFVSAVRDAFAPWRLESFFGVFFFFFLDVCCFLLFD